MRNYLVTLLSGEQIIVEANSMEHCGDRVVEELDCSEDDFEINGVLSNYEAEMLGIDTY